MTTKFLNIHEIKARFSHYANEVKRGKSFIIAMRNKPFAELKPIDPKTKKKLVSGVLKGQFEVPADFNSPVEDFEAVYYDE
jgi:antitoxin (DNA-binding transcriptional repressor) of toxin-antitoxin stability system